MACKSKENHYSITGFFVSIHKLTRFYSWKGILLKKKTWEKCWRDLTTAFQSKFQGYLYRRLFNRIHIYFHSKLVKIKWKANAHTKVIWALNIFSTTWKWLLVVIQSLLTWIYFRLYDILLFLVLGRFDFNFVTEIIKVFAENWLNCVET